jgi:ABC-2 type transport system ATP-binding protein
MNTTSAPPPLEILGLTHRYGTLLAVDGLDLSVRPGEILGFLGPNGAGKTTTLRVAAGLLRPASGEVRIAGASLAREPLTARARFGFVPDRPALYERLTALEFLEFVAALYRLDPKAAEARAHALAERLELAAVAGRTIESYSLGMRQKLSIAAALMHEPALVMLDEPMVGLDPRGARALKDLLREQAARGGGVLVSTHLLDVAENLCDRVLILDRGVKRAEGTLEDLRAGRHATLEDLFLELTAESGGAESER